MYSVGDAENMNILCTKFCAVDVQVVKRINGEVNETESHQGSSEEWDFTSLTGLSLVRFRKVLWIKRIK